jgi:hypothetical protein
LLFSLSSSSVGATSLRRVSTSELAAARTDKAPSPPAEDGPLAQVSPARPSRRRFAPPQDEADGGAPATARPHTRRRKYKAPARLPGGRNSNCGFSPIPSRAVRQKNACQDS